MTNTPWSDWVSESPFELRFRLPFVDYDGADGPYETVRFCGLKAADFAIVDPSRQVLYLLEVKSAEWFLIDKASDWDAKVCDLFRCFIDSLGICARWISNPSSWWRRCHIKRVNSLRRVSKTISALRDARS